MTSEEAIAILSEYRQNGRIYNAAHWERIRRAIRISIDTINDREEDCGSCKYFQERRHRCIECENFIHTQVRKGGAMYGVCKASARDMDRHERYHLKRPDRLGYCKRFTATKEEEE